MFWQLFCYFLIGSLFTLLDWALFYLPKNKQLLSKFLGYTIGLQLATLTFFRFGLKQADVLSSHLYTQGFFFKYFLVACILGGIILGGKYCCLRMIPFNWKKQPFSKRQKFALGIGLILFALSVIFTLGTHWFITAFGRLTPEQFIFNFKSPVNGTATGMTSQIFNTPVLLGCDIFFLFILLCNLAKYEGFYQQKKIYSVKLLRFMLASVTSVSFIFSGIYAIKELRLIEVYAAYFDQSTFIKQEYVQPSKNRLQFPQRKKNLIHIYLESIENSYFDRANGGYMTENLMPDLLALSKEGIHFSGTDTFGGPIQTYGSSWSVAAMVNMSSGLPLKIPMDGNSYGKTGQFLPGAVMLGDLLHEQGYNQTIMFGADADFGGLTSFFSTHGNYHIFDVKYARKAGLIPENYNVWWGFEDNKLYDFTKQELTRLASLHQPFNFTMENADTHFPDGFVEPEMKKLFASQYANVIYHSQKQVVELIRWIQQQPFYSDTVIVLTGDHPSMDKKFFQNFDPKYQRTTFNLILNADFPNQNFETSHRQYAPFDYFPTILASLGVKIKDERLGLGVNLASKQPTLIETYGLKKVDRELAKNSHFYNDHFVDEKKRHG